MFRSSAIEFIERLRAVEKKRRSLTSAKVVQLTSHIYEDFARISCTSISVLTKSSRRVSSQAFVSIGMDLGSNHLVLELLTGCTLPRNVRNEPATRTLFRVDFLDSSRFHAC